MLDVALRAEDQRLGGLARLEVLQVLGGQAVQPGQPVRAGDPDHAAVRAVHHPRAGGQRALLRVGVPVVRGDPASGSSPGTAPGAFSSGLSMLSIYSVGPGGGAARAAPGRGPALRQSAQRPNTVRCPTSVSKP